jgi:hypothetical protein
MTIYRELLIGCGSRREKDIQRFYAMFSYAEKTTHSDTALAMLMRPWQALTTLDINPAHNPDILCDLRTVPFINACWNDCDQPPTLFADNYLDEIHAYEVLEHIGHQGYPETFFAQFTEFHRILRPNGLLCATCPSWLSMWAWGDPSHTRVITSGSLVFLSQRQYQKQVGKTAMSDFRDIYTADFEPLFIHEDNNTLAFVLRAIKP